MLVIKVGGNELDDPIFVAEIGQAIAALPTPPILVHGGGKEIRELQKRLGVKDQYIDGLRVTEAESLDIVQMVLIGRINKRLVSSLSKAGSMPLGCQGWIERPLRPRNWSIPAATWGRLAGSPMYAPKFLRAC